MLRRGIGKHPIKSKNMKTEKLNLKSINNVLSRSEMKKIMAGSGNCVYGSENCVYIYGGTLPCCTGHCVVQPGTQYGTCQPY